MGERPQQRPQRPPRTPPPVPAFTVAPGLSITLSFDLAGRLAEYILDQAPADKQFLAFAHNILNALGDVEEDHPFGDTDEDLRGGGYSQPARRA